MGHCISIIAMTILNLKFNHTLQYPGRTLYFSFVFVFVLAFLRGICCIHCIFEVFHLFILIPAQPFVVF